MAKDTKSSAEKVSPELATRSDLSSEVTRDVSASLKTLLADIFTLYMKTKNFHWHMSGPHFRDYHLMLDEQSDQIFAMTDVLAERARKLGGLTLHSIGEISKLQRIKDNDGLHVEPHAMLGELRDDNLRLTKSMRETRDMCDEGGDCATTSILEVFIDETERRTWFLFESTRTGGNS